MVKGRSSWGSVRRLPSGQWQARVPDGHDRVSIGLFATKRDAERALSATRAAQARAEWVRPADGRITLTEWIEEWAPSTAHLRPRTRDSYAWILETCVLPWLGNVPLRDIDTPRVEAWLSTARAQPTWGPATVAKAYRLLRQVLGAAVRARRIATQPCTVRGGGAEPRPALRIPSMAEVLELADAIDPRWRAMVLLSGGAGLRWGECAGLRWDRVDLLHARVRVDQQLVELQSGRLEFAAPKTEAGVRTVALPAVVVDALREHLHQWPGAPTELVFRAAQGGPLRRSSWSARVWHPARVAVGLERVRWHDLRHCALTTAAQEGATVAELMAQAGHASVAASVRYQHAADERAITTAAKVDEVMRRAIGHRAGTMSS